MRTTLIIPDELLEEARTTLGFRSKTDTVVHALREVVRRGRADALKAALRTVKFEFDPTELRRKDREAL
jgi:Arc/MetJ family transcription regulator